MTCSGLGMATTAGQTRELPLVEPVGARVWRVSDRTLAGGRYVLSEPPIGIGGMGTVWKAFDSVLHREVAVKELRIPEGLSPEERDKLQARAMREARAAAGLDHAGIVTIHDVVDEGGRPWIVMRLLPGRSLDLAVRADGPLSPRRTAELGVRLLDALSAAHAKGVLHRDVKPQNVMLGSDGTWMLTDFGIASIAGATRTLTGTGVVTGTLGYIAPERLSGAEPGAAADLWSLGATLYFAVEGRPAHDHDDLPAMLAAVMTRDPDPPKQAGPLAPVIAGLMERDLGRRLDAEAAREQLLAVADGYPTFERPAGEFGDADRPTEEFGGSTKVLRDGGTRIDPGAQLPEPSSEGVSFVRGNRALRALALQMVALNGVLGALAVFIIYGLTEELSDLTEELPAVAAGALAIGVVGGLGALLVPRLVPWFGLRAVLVGSALLVGESILGVGVVVEPGLVVPGAVLAGVALVAFGGWHRLSGAMRRRIVPEALLSRVTVVYRELGAAAIPLGAAVAACYLWLVDPKAKPVWGGDYLTTPLIGSGGVVIAVALLAILALRGTNEPSKRWGLVATVIAALVLPVFAGGRATVRYVDGLNDFTALPDICASDGLSQDRVARFTETPLERPASSDPESVRCTWEGSGDTNAQLEINLTKWDDSRSASRRLKSKDAAPDGGAETIHVGDKGIRYSYDGFRYPGGATLGVGVSSRIDNVLLSVRFDQSEALGAPDLAQLQALASELVQEIESHKPRR